MKFRQLELFGDDGRPPEAEMPPLPGPGAEALPEALPMEAAIPGEPGMTPGAVQASPPPDSAPADAGPSTPTRRPRKPARQTSRVTSPVELPPDEVLYTRQYYAIGEVAAMFQLKVSVLRYWASEFDVLDLRKNRKGDRFFRPDDVKTVQRIHHLLRVRRFTIEGAREYIRHQARGKDPMEAVDVLRRIRGFLLEIGATLGSRPVE